MDTARTRTASGAVPDVRFEVGPVRTVVTDARRRQLGLDHWVDGTMGFVRRGTTTRVVAPNGPVLSRHVLEPGEDLASGRVVAREAIEGLPATVDHASGGPLHVMGDRVLLVYHGETFADGDPAHYEAFLGMAVSEGDGPFRDLGPIVVPERGGHDPSRERSVDVGPGAFVVRDGWFHVYFQDRGIYRTRHHLSVARARVDDVEAAVRRGVAPRFATYSGTGFDEPAIGGLAADLLEDCRHRVIWFDTAFVPALDCFLLVFSTVVRVGRRAHGWRHATALSRDGAAWSEPALLPGEPAAEEMIYLTIDSEGPDQRRVEGDRFALYVLVAGGGYRWDDARLDRVEVRIAT